MAITDPFDIEIDQSTRSTTANQSESSQNKCLTVTELYLFMMVTFGGFLVSSTILVVQIWRKNTVRWKNEDIYGYYF